MRAEFLYDFENETFYIPTGRRYYDEYDNYPADPDERRFYDGDE